MLGKAAPVMTIPDPASIRRYLGHLGFRRIVADHALYAYLTRVFTNHGDRSARPNDSDRQESQALSGESSVYLLAVTYSDDFYCHNIRMCRIDDLNVA